MTNSIEIGTIFKICGGCSCSDFKSYIVCWSTTAEIAVYLRLLKMVVDFIGGLPKLIIGNCSGAISYCGNDFTVILKPSLLGKSSMGPLVLA